MKLLINGNNIYDSLDHYSYEDDTNWEHRETIYIVVNMSLETALSLFVDNVSWGGYYTEIDDETQEERSQFIDFSDYCIAGPITVNRDNTLIVSMAKKTAAEKLQDSIFVTKEEAEAAFIAGINEI